jgi:glycosyltransferase involved in cell wall biosynthesis
MFLKRALDSVINQTLSPNELIIIDDHSDDQIELIEVVAAYKGLITINYIRLTENFGASKARNIGVMHANYDYIAFLDSDDIWHQSKLEIQLYFMTTNNLYFSAHKYLPIESMQKISIHNNIPFKKIKLISFLFGNFIATPTVMVKRNHFILFDENLLRMEDFKCWIENVSYNKKCYFINLPLSYGFKPSIGSSGLSANVFEMHKSMLSALVILLKSRNINLLFFLFASSIEILKYPIRICILKFKSLCNLGKKLRYSNDL